MTQVGERSHLLKGFITLILMMVGISAYTADGSGVLMDKSLRNIEKTISSGQTLDQIRSKLIELKDPLLASVDLQNRSDEPSYCTVRFSEPIDAKAFIQVFGWARPYAISHDVHQESWHVDVWTKDLKDAYGPRIACRAPLVGVWSIDVQLADRPEGDLPGISCGASPAYDLARYSGNVIGFEVSINHDEQYYSKVENLSSGSYEDRLKLEPQHSIKFPDFVLAYNGLINKNVPQFGGISITERIFTVVEGGKRRAIIFVKSPRDFDRSMDFEVAGKSFRLNLLDVSKTNGDSVVVSIEAISSNRMN